MPITNDTARLIQERLTNTYGLMWSVERGREVIRLLKDQMDDDTFTGAVERHLTNSIIDRKGTAIGSYPPTPATIKSHADDIIREQEYGQQAELRGWGDGVDQKPELTGRTIPIPEVLHQYFPTLREFRVLDVNCKHCGDNGYARYYYLREDPDQVFLPDELDLQEPGLIDQLAIATCNCAYCEKGQARESRRYFKFNNKQLLSKIHKRTVGKPYVSILVALAERREA